MKIGDLAVWSKYAAEWSGAPEAGSLAGVVVRILKHRRGPRIGRANRVELHAEGKTSL